MNRGYSRLFASHNNVNLHAPTPDEGLSYVPFAERRRIVDAGEMLYQIDFFEVYLYRTAPTLATSQPAANITTEHAPRLKSNVLSTTRH